MSFLLITGGVLYLVGCVLALVNIVFVADTKVHYTALALIGLGTTLAIAGYIALPSPCLL